MRVFSKARDLTGRRHLDAEGGVGARKSRKRKLWNFDSKLFFAAPQHVHLLNFFADDQLRGHRDEVVAESLRHEWERSKLFQSLS